MKARINKLIKKKGKISIRHVFLILLIFAVVLISGFYFYFSSGIKIGDFVYKKTGDAKIGEVKGRGFPLNYLVKWQDDSYSEESFSQIGKLSELKEGDVQNILKENNQAYNFYPSVSEKETEELPGEENQTEESREGEIIFSPGLETGGSYILKVGEKGCKPNFICEKWQACRAEYDVESLIKGGLSLGIKYRKCKDYGKCMSDFIDSRTCEFEIPIDTKKVKWCNQEYVEIYDKLNGKFVGRVKQGANRTKLDVEFIVSDFTGYCEYCFDKMKNYDEEEVDCGGSCPACREYALKKSYFNYRTFNFIFTSLFFLSLLIFVIYLSLSRDKKKKKSQLPE